MVWCMTEIRGCFLPSGFVRFEKLALSDALSYVIHSSKQLPQYQSANWSDGRTANEERLNIKKEVILGI